MRIDNKFIQRYYFDNIRETKKKIKEAVSADNLIIHTIKNIDELQKTANLLSKRLREWYALYIPEFVRALEDNKKFAEIVLKKSKNELLKEIKIKSSESMGAELKKDDVDEILALAKEIVSLFALIKKHEDYLEVLMKERCLNMYELTGSLIGAQLLEHAGSLKHLAEMTSSTIQLLGAEKALFRHMRTGAKSPKHGLIIQHPFVANAKAADKGKAARVLADKISIAVRVDFFKGKPIGKKLKKELDEKFK